MGLFSRKSKAEKLAASVKDTATDLMEQGKKWVAPKVDDLREQVQDNFIPAMKSKVDDVKDAVADSAVSEKATSVAKKGADVAKKELKKAEAAVNPKPKKRGRKALIFVLISAAIAAVGYVFWKRSQPLEDPWAEEYWEDIDFDDVVDKAEDVKDDVAEKAQDVKDDVKDKAGDVAEQVADAVEKAKEKVAK